MMSSQVDHIIQQTRRYWYEDGFVEIATGTLFVVVAALLATMELVPHDSFWFPIIVVGMPLVVIGAGVPVKKFVMTLKERVTYPRTGYVAFHHETNRSRWLVAGVAFFASIIIVLGGRWLDHMTAVAGLIMGAAFASLALRFGAVRFYILGALAAVFGLGVALLTDLSDTWGMAGLMGVAGAGSVVSGLMVLRGYLRQNPSSQEA
jgi:hypothetical protein